MTRGEQEPVGLTWVEAFALLADDPPTKGPGMSRREDLHTPNVEAAAWFERTQGVPPLADDDGITAADVPSGPGEDCGHLEPQRDCLACAFRRVFGGGA